MEYLRGSNGSYYYERDKTKYLAGGNPSPAIIASQHYNWGWANEGTTKMVGFILQKYSQMICNN